MMIIHYEWILTIFSYLLFYLRKGGLAEGQRARGGGGGGVQQWPCSLLAILDWVSVPGIYNRGLMFAAWSF